MGSLCAFVAGTNSVAPLLSLLSLAATYAPTPTQPQALVAAGHAVVSRVAEAVGPIHINPAEQGLLETIWLLATSIVCVPAVCKFIPGGSPVLGYLVSFGLKWGGGGAGVACWLTWCGVLVCWGGGKQLGGINCWPADWFGRQAVWVERTHLGTHFKKHHRCACCFLVVLMLAAL